MILVDVRQFKFSVLYLHHVQKALVEIFFIKNLLAIKLMITLLIIGSCLILLKTQLLNALSTFIKSYLAL